MNKKEETCFSDSETFSPNVKDRDRTNVNKIPPITSGRGDAQHFKRAVNEKTNQEQPKISRLTKIYTKVPCKEAPVVHRDRLSQDTTLGLGTQNIIIYKPDYD